MFNERAFRTWGHVLMGACVVSGLFLVLMLMVEEVVGRGGRLSRAAVTVTAAAFLGYLGTAWIIRLDRPADG
ncbi:MAG: ABC transporter permease [Bacteroidetes bacterium SW_9_63_38]|nr:MAG: ABC transporter permease [Bacteroidetes bacterium SW_9_63_38]